MSFNVVKKQLAIKSAVDAWDKLFCCMILYKFKELA